jgi:uncharacterized membrane protein
MRKWERKHPLLNTFIVLIAVILMWRGIWGLLDYYVFPENPVLSYVIGAAIGFLILILDDFELNEL